MDKTIIENKSIELAIVDAVQRLGVNSKDDLEIKIIKEGSKGFLGFGAKNAVIEVNKKFDPEKQAVNFLRELALHSGLVVTITSKFEGKNLDIAITGDDAHTLIGKRGTTLESLQYITSLVVNKGENSFVNLVIDIENYRQRRKETLENLATNLGKKVIKTKRPVILEPMTSYERRIIHVTLQETENIKTQSQGQEPYRHVVISYKK